MTPLSYSLPGFHPHAYDDAARRLEELRALGFRAVTFHPTWLVYDEVPLRIDLSQAPKLDVVRLAAEMGFEHIMLDPHLDFESTFTGGPYRWRRRMYLDPRAGDHLSPAAGLLASVARPGLKLYLTLGSELDVSVIEFGLEWLAVADQIRNPAFAVGHKLNHDFFDAAGAIRAELTQERARRGLAACGPFEYRRRAADAATYLARLDYVSFSFYPSVAQDPDFAAPALRLKRRLRKTAGETPSFAIGEFGLGCPDPSRPYHVDSGAFLNHTGNLDPVAQDLRRRYYLRFFDFLRSHPDLCRGHPATFWTAGHFDFLGVLEQDARAIFRDDKLREAVFAYNQGGSL
ncbi:MAG: hypothetical protein HYZ57_16320 [Acidobacteria bacterium]|nr:hypothetical protein [Acidobacteriota bacterium]